MSATEVLVGSFLVLLGYVAGFVIGNLVIGYLNGDKFKK